MEAPLVSISCVSYNHATFIRHCLDGMLMQKTSFPIEILIHDDCSTDGTTEIIKEYEAKYPSLIFALYENENQYSKGAWVDGFNYRRAKGKYIAYCEGDDYWTDPLKLQKQVDFMEAHPDYSVCFHGIDVVNAITGKSMERQYGLGCESGIDITPEMYLHGKWVQPLSMLFRLSDFSFEWRKNYTCYVDTMEIYHLLKAGKGRFMNFIGGVYHIHPGGVASSNTDVRNSWENVRDIMEMYKVFGDDILKTYYINNVFWRMDVCKRHNIKNGCRQLHLFTLKESPMIELNILSKCLKKGIKNCLKKKN